MKENSLDVSGTTNRSEKIRGVISDVTGIAEDELTGDMSLLDDIAPNSIDRITLLMALEDEFGRPIPEQELKDVNTLDQLVSFVESTLSGGTQAQ